MSRAELEQFLADREGRFQGLLVSDGVIYRTTPFEVISWIFDCWRGEIGDLAGKRLLDFGAGDLRYGLLASNLLGMNGVAAEFDSVVFLDAKENFEEARRRGYTVRLILQPRMNALHLPWGEFDLVHSFYTHPDTVGRDRTRRTEFRQRLQQKTFELEPGAFLSLLFTDAQIRAGRHEFASLIPHYNRLPSFAGPDGVSYHLQLYTCE